MFVPLNKLIKNTHFLKTKKKYNLIKNNQKKALPSVKGINILPLFTGMAFNVDSSKFKATVPSLSQCLNFSAESNFKKNNEKKVGLW